MMNNKGSNQPVHPRTLDKIKAKPASFTYTRNFQYSSCRLHWASPKTGPTRTGQVIRLVNFFKVLLLDKKSVISIHDDKCTI